LHNATKIAMLAGVHSGGTGQSAPRDLHKPYERVIPTSLEPGNAGGRQVEAGRGPVAVSVKLRRRSQQEWNSSTDQREGTPKTVSAGLETACLLHPTPTSTSDCTLVSPARLPFGSPAKRAFLVDHRSGIVVLPQLNHSQRRIATVQSHHPNNVRTAVLLGSTRAAAPVPATDVSASRSERLLGASMPQRCSAVVPRRKTVANKIQLVATVVSTSNLAQVMVHRVAIRLNRYGAPPRLAKSGYG
jgi:hypothetical protein